MKRKLLAAFGLFGIPVLLVVNAQYAQQGLTIYVAPNGRADNSGTAGSPLDLATALKPGRVRPGSTILLRGGAYVGPFRSDLMGTESAPITMRSETGENAVITTYQSRGDGGVFNVYGAWTIYRDFEVTSSSLDRAYGTEFRLMGLNILAPHTKFINLVVHDAGHGFGFWKEAVNSELYGNLIFNNGSENTASDMRHGHAIYTQNSEGEKAIRDNVMFDQFGWGIHAYPSPGGVMGYRIEGNISFDNGLASHPRLHFPNLMVSGHRPFKTDRVTIANNFSYYPPGQDQAGKFTDANLCLGCSDPEANGSAQVTGNYLVNGVPVVLANGWQDFSMTGNTVIGKRLLVGLNGPQRRSYAISKNTYFAREGTAAFLLNGKEMDASGWQRAGFDSGSAFQAGVPSANAVFVRPNQYEPGRAHVVVYNWTHAGSVQVNLSNVLQTGNHYRIWNVQDLAGRPVAEGVFSGAAISIPIGSARPVPPAGAERKLSPEALSTGAEFGVFLVRRVDMSVVAAKTPRAPMSPMAAASAADPLAKLRPFEGEYLSADGKAKALITADTSGLSVRMLSENGAPQYRLTQVNGPRFRMEGLPRGFFVVFNVQDDRVLGIKVERSILPAVNLTKQ